MSKTRDKIDNLSDYIYIETVSIKFILKTKGDFITHDLDPIPFHPNMSDVVRFTNSSQILFPSFIKISQSDVNKNSKIGASRIELFTHLDLYSKFIKKLSKERVTPLTTTGLLVIEKDKNRDNDNGDNFKRIMVSSEYISKAEIIVNNIGVLKNVFFPINGNIFMLGHKFLITESRYISHEASEEVYDYSNKKFKLPKSYTVTIELNILDATNNENIGKFSERSCIAKKTSILKDIDEIFITKNKSKIMMPINTLKTVMTVNRNFGKLITDWEIRNIYKQPPRTEREKIEFESRMDPFMRNKKEYDEKMVEINNLPPGYVKELNKLDEDFLSFEKRIQDISEHGNADSEYNKKLLQILFNDINKSQYNIEKPADYETKEADYETKESKFLSDVKKNSSDSIKNIKGGIEKEIYDKYKPESEEQESVDTVNKKIAILEKEFTESNDEAKQKEIKSKIEKLRSLEESTSKYNVQQTRDVWERIVRSVNAIKKAVKINENKEKVEALKNDNQKNISSIEKKIIEIYKKLKILNSRRRNKVEESLNDNSLEGKNKLLKRMTDLIGKSDWPYFIPHIYSREKTYQDMEDPIDTKDELITELTGYYANYIKLQNSLNTGKRLNGSISILKLQNKSLKEMIDNTNKIIKKLNDDRGKIRDTRGDPGYALLNDKITMVGIILQNQENIEKAFEVVITKLSVLNTSKINKSEDEYIPSNDDGKIIQNIVNNIIDKKSNTLDLQNDSNNTLYKLISKKTSGGSKISRKKKFISRKKHNNNNNNNYKKYNITKKNNNITKKNNNITKKKYIKRI